MDYEQLQQVYQYIFYGGAILAVVMLIVSVLLFFGYNIPSVIGDLTGATARKAIENIRNQNESTGDKLYKSSPVNRERGKITDKISPSGNLIKNPSEALGGAMATEKIGTQQLTAEETTVLGGAAETTVLGAGAAETTVLGGAAETTVLNAEVGETSVLDAPQGTVFAIEYEITLIHTDEIIA